MSISPLKSYEGLTESGKIPVESSHISLGVDMKHIQQLFTRHLSYDQSGQRRNTISKILQHLEECDEPRFMAKVCQLHGHDQEEETNTFPDALYNSNIK